MSRDVQEAAAAGMEQDAVDPALVSAKKLWRMVRAVYLVVGKGLGKHQPKLAALGVHLHHLLSKRHHHHHHHHHHRGGGLLSAAREHPALAYLSCRSMDPAAAVVHPYPRGGGASLSSLSCRSMDAVDAAYQYQYRPREVQFSCKSTPLNKWRRRAHRRGVHLQPHGAGAQYGLPEHSSATTVTRLFELMDVREATDDEIEADADELELEIATPWAAAPAVIGPTPRQVRITDSPFLAREEDEGSAVVDRRADEFITWFHEQLRMQQQQQQRPAAAPERTTTYWIR